MCPDRNLLSSYFDGELDERFSSMIEAHLSECDSCRRILESFETLSSALHQEEIPDTEAGKQRIWSVLQGKFSSLYPAPVWRRRLLVPAPVMVAAAFLVIALGIGLFLSMTVRHQSGVFDTVTSTNFEQAQFVSIEDIIKYLDARGNGQALVFTLPREAKLQFVSEPTLMRAADYKRGID